MQEQERCLAMQVWEESAKQTGFSVTALLGLVLTVDSEYKPDTKPEDVSCVTREKQMMRGAVSKRFAWRVRRATDVAKTITAS